MLRKSNRARKIDLKLIESIIDDKWYLQSHPEAIQSRSAAEHYLDAGANLEFDPNPLFLTKWYLQGNPDVAKSGLNPLIHFMKHGWKEGRNPHPLFDVSHYLKHNADVAAAGVNPLVHFILHGGLEGRSPHPLFDAAHYIQSNPDVAAECANPLIHYLRFGADRGSNPNPMFDSAWYRDQHESKCDGVNPLIHYIRHGYAEERDPSQLFDTSYYLIHNQDIFQAGVDPLGHYLTSGLLEGRQPRPPDRLIARCAVTDIPLEIRKKPHNLADRDVCLFILYSSDGEVYDHVLYYLDALKKQGLAIVVVVATDGLEQPLPAALDKFEGLLVRTNHGWDFAAWAAALTALPELWRARNLILANDSLYGPVSDMALRDILQRVRKSDKDLVALTDSYQQWRHMMSFFVGITRAGLASSAVRAFWADVKSIQNKEQVIWDYELNAFNYWIDNEVSVEILFPAESDDLNAINPTLSQWRELLDRGFPFLKVQLLRDDLPTISRAGWREKLIENPELREAIEKHLDGLAMRRQKSSFRPVPAPRRRFKRPQSLTTSYGATQSTRPTDETDLALEVPFRYGIDDATLPEVVAVVAHIFYPEMAAELLARFQTIPVQADLFLTTDTDAKRGVIENVFAAYCRGKVEVRVFPNVGRDVAPTIVGCRDVFDRYEIFLHIHSKKSPHSGRFADWRSYLLDNLLGSPDIVRSILRLLSAEDVGIVFAQHFPAVRSLLNWGYDFDLAKGLLARAGVVLTRDLVLDFPSSSFFWGRSAALRPLLDLDLGWSDFPTEDGQIDGTIMHAIERSILYFAEHAGFRWAKVAASQHSSPRTTVPVHNDPDIEDGLSRAYRPLIGNPLRPLASARLFPEVTPVSTRSSPNRKPRLNLLIPTLNPKQIFGGITTALRLFSELAHACGDDFDRRIICVNGSVDLHAMGVVGDYTLRQLGDFHQDSGAVVIDLSDNHGGELSLRPNDIFVGTAWWTAVLGYDLQAKQNAYHHAAPPLIYVIQDYETGFYPWSDRFGRAASSYRHLDKTIALINSEELANFMCNRYTFYEASVVRYKANPKIQRSLSVRPRERIVLLYGRPSVDRNCFQTICGALYQWQQSEPVLSQRWRIISAGEEYVPSAAVGVRNLEVLGKLELSDYADLLSRASVGVSLMISPHPSYPPLEMAYAGLRTITNSYESKNLTHRSPNLVSIDEVTPEELASAISKAVSAAEADIGKTRPFLEIMDIPCELPDYNPIALARLLNEHMS